MLSDNEIIKALEWHLNDENYCDECPLFVKKNTTTYCVDELFKSALDLINRQKAEIERLHKLQKPTETSGYKIENGKVVFYTNMLNGYRHEYANLDEVVKDLNLMLQNAYASDEVIGHYKGKLKTAKSEAIKELAAELYNSLRQYENYDTHHTYEILDRIESVEEFLLNNLVKEMVGDDNG